MDKKIKIKSPLEHIKIKPNTAKNNKIINSKVKIFLLKNSDIIIKKIKLKKQRINLEIDETLSFKICVFKP
jgi:hypothetical protein